MKETSNPPHPKDFLAPCVVVHGIDQAAASLAAGLPVTLLSARGAAGFAGVAWWRCLVRAARLRHPATPCQDVLDCGSAAGLAMSALRVGQILLVLEARCPTHARVSAAAEAQGGHVLADRPPALDLAEHGAMRRLAGFLAASKGV